MGAIVRAMRGSYHHGMDSVGPAEINRILAVTDALGIQREAVVVPLGTAKGGRVRFNARRKIEITATSDGFDEWLQALPAALRAMGPAA